ncbi:response regulator [Anaeromyxobacter paludicola]|uniref:Response regulatory domain-containing protein n=1 Tax=Anaeromyxobacter paludicola TaxID=2918171 RepID=A0ABM7XF20_9BACT|nr:response regulator [Anaeromyxobacter paludicola]BDG10498.1 hypothetical protein AMPC_36110 [Anaeromyxobacter paludicola]
MGSGANILLVEDDAAIRESVADCLVFEGYRVRSASNGRDGLDLLRREKPAVVVLDLLMPVLGGAQFLEEQRRDPEIAGVPVVLMTAAMPSGRNDIPQATAYLPKPFDLADLLAVVARFAGPGGAGKPA